MITLAIKMNGDTAFEPCAICSGLTPMEFGPELFVEGTQEPVCWECGRAHALELVWMLERYREALVESDSAITAVSPAVEEWPDPFQQAGRSDDHGPAIRLA